MTQPATLCPARPRSLTAATETLLTAAVTGTVQAADTTARTITGTILTYGETGPTNLGPTRFAKGSLPIPSDPARVKMLIEHAAGTVVGKATRIWDEGDKLMGTFTVASGAVGDEVLASASEGMRDSLSIGVAVTTSRRGADGALEVSAAIMREVSMVAIPAFASALVSQVAASVPAGGAHTSPAAGQLAPYAAVHAGANPFLPGQVAAALQGATPNLDAALNRMTAAGHVGGAHAALTAALTDVLLPTDPTQRDAFVRPQWLGELFEANKFDRPIIDSIGRAPLDGLTVQGWRFKGAAPVDAEGVPTGAAPGRPFGVGEYAGNKTPVPSPGGFSIEPHSENARRIAAGHDVDRAFVDLGNSGLLRSYFDWQTINYLVLTEQLAAQKLQAEATALPGAAPTDPVDAMVKLVTYLSRRGAQTSFLAVGSDVWAELLAITDNEKPWLFGGAASITLGTATVGGVNIALNDGLAARGVLAGDKRAATFHEWKNPPLAIQAVNIAQGGVDLGVFGYWGLITHDPAAIVKSTVL